ncbi:hypothetical protein SFMTTN_1557 [Sulfuriferula multivorans]|uniref:Uncharacterized protein n=1 Tax=Sulfuriferula multivorans TaxID=1559896 RepID=A0A401JDV2_9PROT|nr:hypothetical protein SFMTTN_1557 [Sulfuriferula multivorans]
MCVWFCSRDGNLSAGIFDELKKPMTATERTESTEVRRVCIVF